MAAEHGPRPGLPAAPAPGGAGRGRGRSGGGRVRALRVCLGLALALAGVRVQGQEAGLVEVERIRIGLGRADGEIGIDRDGGEDWKPLFFDVDREGRIHVPDFYKGRIAVFDRQGRLARRKACPEGISPRMNFFCLAPDGAYVTFSDHHLYCLRADGSLAWKRDLGIGAIPSFILANEAGIFMELPFADGRSLVFDYSSDRPIGRFGYTVGEEGVAMIATPGQGRFTVRLSRMRGLVGVAATAYRLPQEARLVRVDAGNRSLWQSKDGRTELYSLFSGTGELLRQGRLALPDGAPGSGFWTVADERLWIYRNHFLDAAMEIIACRFPD